MAYNTTCLVCHRAGRGWSIDKIFTMDGLVSGAKCMQNWMCQKEKLSSLTKWIQKTHRDTWKTDKCVVSSVYLYDIQAPGEWCQIFWECPDEATANKVRNNVKNRGDIEGIYIVDKLLNDLTQKEKEYYYNVILRA